MSTFIIEVSNTASKDAAVITYFHNFSDFIIKKFCVYNQKTGHIHQLPLRCLSH